MGDNKRIKEFKRMCRLQQMDLKEKLQKMLENMGREVISGDGYLYSPSPTDEKVLLMAHMDTVHAIIPYEIYNKNGILSSPNGIGGDDRCGVFMIMEIIKDKNYQMPVVFFEDEETGGKGSNKFVHSGLGNELTSNFNYVIELDRRGSNDAVFYYCDNKEFENFVTENGKGYWKTNMGTFSDICNICPALECAGVNLSCGYYNEHTKTEYVVWDEMIRNISEIKKLIARSDNKFFEYIDCYENGNWFNNYRDYCRSYDYYDDYDDKSYKYDYGYEIYHIYFTENGHMYCYETEAVSEYEAIGKLMSKYRKLCYNDIEFVLNGNEE